MDKTARNYAFVMLFSVIFGSILLTSFFVSFNVTSLLARNLITYSLLYLLPGVIFFVKTREVPSVTLSLRKTDLTTILLTLIISLTVQPILMCISTLTAKLFVNFVDISLVSYVQQPLPAVLFSAALVPAICEEACCRGIFLSHCEKRAPWLSALLSGLFFGLLHMNLQQGLYAVVFGFLCALLTLFSDSILPCILMHFLINSTQLLMAFCAADLPASGLNFIQRLVVFMLDESKLGMHLLIALPLAAVSVFCLLAIRRRHVVRP